MKLTFLGTRANTEERNRRHRRHSALLVSSGSARVMLDCGLDWLGELDRIAPTAIVVTHAHPDHAWGLTQGAPCVVWATEDGWNGHEAFPIKDKRLVRTRAPFQLDGLAFEAFPVDHSIRAPTVGYRVSDAGASFFYVPDVVAIPARSAALKDVDLYIGDGATLTKSLVRRRDGVLFGHTPVRTQLGWCQKEEVGRALFTHCGAEIITGNERTLGALLRRMVRERGVEARFAHDGLEVTLSGDGSPGAHAP